MDELALSRPAEVRHDNLLQVVLGIEFELLPERVPDAARQVVQRSIAVILDVAQSLEEIRIREKGLLVPLIVLVPGVPAGAVGDVAPPVKPVELLPGKLPIDVDSADDSDAHHQKTHDQQA